MLFWTDKAFYKFNSCLCLRLLVFPYLTVPFYIHSHHTATDLFWRRFCEFGGMFVQGQGGYWGTLVRGRYKSGQIVGLKPHLKSPKAQNKTRKKFQLFDVKMITLGWTFFQLLPKLKSLPKKSHYKISVLQAQISNSKKVLAPPRHPSLLYLSPPPGTLRLYCCRSEKFVYLLLVVWELRDWGKL